ncbi:MAG TPA: GDSL-type esterase/lipase family protein [Myxococcota bacterium]|nr:GDSL-type esterase/lipase family protein [Myxococcota bacterium]
MVEPRRQRLPDTRKRLRLAWLAGASAPLLLLVAQGAGRTTFVAWAVWALGGLLLEAALRRDPEARALASLRARGTDLLLVALSLVVGQAAVLLLPAALAIFGALLAAVSLIALWAGLGPTPRFASVVRGAALATSVVVAGLAAGELVCRLPVVVARTGGHLPGIQRFKRERYDFLWQRNPLHLRSFHTDAPKPDGVREILALGDDATFGTLVARTEDTWPYVLERSLVADGVAVQVVNAGQESFTTANEAEWLARVGFRFAPDLLIVQYGLNDAVPSRPDFGNERSFSYYHLRPLLPLVHEFLAEESYLYSALDSFKEHQEMRRLHPEGYAPLYEEGYEGWRQVRDALQEIGAFAKARGVPALLVIFPDLEPDTRLEVGAYRYAGIHEKVRAAAEAAGLGVLDLFPVFAALHRPPESWWPLPCEPLPAEEAQRLAAATIRAAIAERGLLPPSETR